MTVQISTLRVAPELDASKYTAGAQQKVAADKSMAASSAEVGQAVQQQDVKISQAGDVLARLSRQYVDGYASAQRMQSAVNSLSRGIETGKITMSQATPILEGIFRKYGQLGDGAQFAAKGQAELAAAIAATTAKMTAQERAAQMAGAATTRLSVAANQNARGGTLLPTANIAAQFQDIGVTSAMGMNPIQIALQQGTQLSAVFEQIKASGTSAGAALLGAFTSILNPVSLLTIGLVGLSAVAIQYFSKMLTDSQDSEETLRKQAELIDKVANQWKGALPALSAYNTELARTQSIQDAIAAGRAAATQQYTPSRTQIPGLNVDITDAVNALQQLASPDDIGRIVELQNAFSTLSERVKNSTATGQDALAVSNQLTDLLNKYGIIAIGDYAGKFKTLADQLDEAAGKAKKFREEAAMLAQMQSLGPLDPLNGFRRTPFQTEEEMMFERSRLQREAEENKRLGALVPIPTPRPSLEDIPEPKSPGADYLKTQADSIEMLKAEIGLVGQSAQARERQIAVLQVEQEIRRRGIDLYGSEAEQIRANAVEQVALAQRLAELRKQQTDSLAAQQRIQQDVFGYANDQLEKLIDGTFTWRDALKSLIPVLMNLLNELTKGNGGTSFGGFINNLSDLFSGKGIGTTNNAANAGGFAANTTLSAILGASNDNYAPGAVTRSPLGNLSAYASAIKSIESAGSGGYSALGPVLDNGNQALGAYQIMRSNLPSWSAETFGKSMSQSEFMANPAAQDAIFEKQFGKLLSKYGNPQDAASAWFTGGPLSAGANKMDALGTTGSAYVDKFNKALGQATNNLGGFAGGLGELGKSLMSVGGGAGGGGWFSNLMSLFGGASGATNFMMGISPWATRDIASGSWGLFASGGYTGPGGADQPAGIVHKGEVVWSQSDVNRSGGVAAVEAMRRGNFGRGEHGIRYASAAPVEVHVVSHVVSRFDGNGNFESAVEKTATPIAKQAANSAVGNYSFQQRQGGAAADDHRYRRLKRQG